jgi:hypothetical protein
MAVVVTACPADTLAVVRHNDQVPVTSLYRIALTRDEETVLTARARSLRDPYRDPAAGPDRARDSRRQQ